MTFRGIIQTVIVTNLICTIILILFSSCSGPKDNCGALKKKLTPLDYVPIKPYVVFKKIHLSDEAEPQTSFRIFCHDAKGEYFIFDVSYNEGGKYHVGDTIK
jgi:hypothetical protein